MLRIEHFSKQYAPGRYAVQDLTLHVAPGEICGFLGRRSGFYRGRYHRCRQLHPHPAGAGQAGHGVFAG